MHPTEDQISPSLIAETESSQVVAVTSAVTSDDPVRGLSDVTVPVTKGLPSDDPVRGLSDEQNVEESASEIDIPDNIPENVNADNSDSFSVVADSESVSDDEIIICQLNSSSLLHVKVQVNNIKCTAVVDSAAEVTLISDKVYKQLKPVPEVLKKLHIKTAGRDMKMDAYQVGPIKIKLGGRHFKGPIFVAPIDDDMLLGLDFLRAHGININLRESCLVMGDTRIAMETKRKKKHNDSLVQVATVTLGRRTGVPPNTVVTVKCDIDQPLSEYIFEPADNLKVMIPRSFHSSEVKPKIALVNVTDKFITLKKSKVLGAAKVADVILESESDPGNMQERDVTDDKLQI